ncbi:gamma-glutamylcyclotransferase [Grimontia kaedaensis]|uniref:Putative gamma-glutamylcyclotransferase n=1 Tax=Grimontia kaedaensis TaxID=2872157 RepID=A0ABY4X1K8_9GAMM|nr:gamma-glutamylcyclotransferase family protein [Grimontia kaedaensis]USH05134.1 gamma-glutamylcyclotransferase [Grimontia kaedaensis]
MVSRLFVYGTLAPGRPNEHVLALVPGTWEPASVKGKLLQEGWGAEHGYPGITLEETSDNVEGFIFSSEALPSHWKRLDEFEGEGYQRVLTQAACENGKIVEAYVYALR